MGQRKYYAFISYCHRDKPKARRLYRRLQRYRVPRSLIRQQAANGQAAYPARLTPIFIDDEEMMGTSVKQGMLRGLSQSRYLVVVCSPNSAGSAYVNYEAEYFVQDGREDRIIPYIISGTPCSGDPDTECYPPAIRKADRLGADEQQLKEDALLRVIATILDLDMGVLSRKERQRKIRWILCLGAAVVLALTGFTLYSQHMNRRIADQHRLMLQSEAKRLTASAVDGNVDMDLSILLASQACDYLPAEQVEESESLTAFRSAVLQKRVAETRDFLIPMHTLTFDTTDIEICRSYADGRRLACRAGENTCLFDLSSGECVYKRDSREVYFAPDASWCVVTQIEGDKSVATGMDVPSGEVLFRTEPRGTSGMWSKLPDVVVFEDDGATAYLVSSEGPDRAPVDGVSRDGGTTRFDAVPQKVRQVFDALAPGETWYNLALTDAWYTAPHALGQEGDPQWSELTDSGVRVEGAQVYAQQGLKLYQCRLEKENREETLLFDLATDRRLGVVPGQAYYDPANGFIYARLDETVRVYRTVDANRALASDADAPLVSGIGADGSRCFFLYQSGDDMERFKSSQAISQRVEIRSLEDRRVLFESGIYVPQMQTCLCYTDDAMNGVLFLDPEGVFHYYDVSRGEYRFSWPAKDPKAVSALCFNEAEDLIAIAVLPENMEDDEFQFLYQIELRDLETGELLATCDITEQLDADYAGIDITTVRLLDGKLLVGTALRSCLFDVSDRGLDEQSCILFDPMQGNSADPLCSQLSPDGLLFFTTAVPDGKMASCLSGVYDIRAGRSVLDFPDSALFAYDAEDGTLLCQPYTADGTLASGVRVYRRQADGGFLNTGEILSPRPDMRLAGGRNVLDGGCVMLQNDECSEIYRVADGARMLRLNNTGFALRNGVIYDMKPCQSLGAVHEYRLGHDEVKALAQSALQTGDGMRAFTQAELERYYIVTEEGPDGAPSPQ